MIVDQYKALDEILKVTKDNNEMLQSMKRHQRWASIFRAIYWIIIAVVSLGAYYFIQPYLDTLLDTYNKISETTNTLTNIDVGSIFGN